MGKIEDNRQCVSFGPRPQVLNSWSQHDFAMKKIMAKAARGTGTRKTVW